MLDRWMGRRGGWRRKLFTSNEYLGAFLIRGESGRSRRIHGRLARAADGTVAVYVENPPRRGLYAQEHCLQYVSGDWFRLHFERPPRSFESAILFTEHFLQCCLAGREVG